MSDKSIQIAVLLREVCDPNPPARLTEDGYGVSDRGLRRFANPADICALEQALRMAEGKQGSVTVFVVGPSRLEDLLRLALSMGADRAIRVWDSLFAGGDDVADARLIERLIQIFDCDFFLTGNGLLDRGAAPVPALASAGLSMPYVTAAVDFEFQGEGIEVLRKSDRGAKQLVALGHPCTLMFEDGCCEPRYPHQDALMAALEMPVEHWGLAELGLTISEVGSYGAKLGKERCSFPRLNPKRVVTPDADLPAFDRILALLSGGIKPREGKLHHGSAEEMAEMLLGVFQAEGLVGGGQK
ncbi:MAG: electron transfer flavoprotein subunit beta [Desulfuromonas sp.]|nr:electron transfer flavoprotein subunit beta [Desulfuromonas sp.]